MLLQEYRPFQVNKQLVEASIKRNKPLIVSGVLQRANAKNQNERVYPKDILAREAASYKQNFVTQRRALGEKASTVTFVPFEFLFLVDNATTMTV